jgi:predicted Zn-dependent protease
VLGALAPFAAGASVSVDSEAWLVDQVLRAEEGGSAEVARDALNKLVLHKPESEAVALKSLQNSFALGADKEKIRRILTKLCSTPTALLCVQARELEKYYAPENRQARQQIELLLAAGQYAEALKAIEKLAGGVPREASLRLFYYETMMRIPQQRLKALDGLEALLKDSRRNPFVQVRVRRILRQHRIAQLSDFGLDRIYNERDRDLAERALAEALRLDPENPLAPRWRAALLESRYWSNLRLADKALEAGDLKKAEEYYRQAVAAQKGSPYGYLGLADIALKRKKFDEARRWIDLAIANSGRESAEERSRIAARKNAITLAELDWNIERLEKQGKYAELVPLLKKQLALDPKNAWLAYRIGTYLQKLGREAEALHVFDGFTREELRQNGAAYPYALLLSALGKTDEALAVLRAVRSPNRDVLSLLARLEADEAMTAARRLAKEGKWEEALREVSKIRNPAPYMEFFKAECLMQLKRFGEAESIYLRLADNPDYALESRLRLAGLYTEAGRRDEARRILSWFAAKEPRELRTEDWLDVISLYERIGDEAAAEKLYRTLFDALRDEFKGENAVFYRNYGRLLARTNRAKEALDVYRAGFAAKGMTPPRPSDEVFTRAMLTPDEPDPDWVRAALRRDASALYQKENTVFTAGLYFSRDRGSPGYSDVTSFVNILEAQTPYKGGTLRLRQDNVYYSVGSLPADRRYKKFGYCYGETRCNEYGPLTKDFGASYAVAWDRGSFGFDIGTTPIGFHYTDAVGSVHYKYENAVADTTFSLYRRPKDSSLLAYGGQRDPKTGLYWGGVRRNGAEVSVSRPLTGNSGLWAFANAEYITGRHVANNNAVQAMAGYYHHIVDRPNHRITFGTSSFFWHFGKDLSGYTVGQGGYYSPKLSVSQSVSLAEVGRTPKWAWDVQARMSLGYSKEDASRRYPLGAPAFKRLTDGAAVDSGSSGGSVSFGIRGAVERRVTPHLVVGAASEYQNADGYTPFIAMLYLRYYWHAWNGDLPLGITPPQPYSRW